MTDAPRLNCPKCGTPDGLWAAASFPGWHSIDATLVDGRRVMTPCRRGTPYHEITGGPDRYDLERLDIGCSCGWEGALDDLVDADGETPRTIHPRQEALDV